jgi:hypothetical protein
VGVGNGGADLFVAVPDSLEQGPVFVVLAVVGPECGQSEEPAQPPGDQAHQGLLQGVAGDLENDVVEVCVCGRDLALVAYAVGLLGGQR